MNKKVLMINGSFRKNKTYNLLLQIEKILKKYNFEVEILNLFDYEIKHCIGCESCIIKSGCGLNDDMPVIKQKIMDCDGLVLSSPVYLHSVTSKFKSFADRTCSWFHKPQTAGKPVLFVTTTNATGIKETHQFFESFATGFGARSGGLIARKAKAINQPVQEHECAKLIALLEQDKKEYRPAMNELVLFEVQKVLASQSNGEDHAFWDNQNWFDQPYYYPCKIGFFKTCFAKMMYKILSKAMK